MMKTVENRCIKMDVKTSLCYAKNQLTNWHIGDAKWTSKQRHKMIDTR